VTFGRFHLPSLHLTPSTLCTLPSNSAFTCRPLETRPHCALWTRQLLVFGYTFFHHLERKAAQLSNSQNTTTQASTMRGAGLAVLLGGLANLASSDTVLQALTHPKASRLLHNSSLVAVSFGSLDNVQFSEPSIVQTAVFNPNNIASDETWNRLKAKGAWYGCLLDMTDEKAGKALGDTRTPPSAESVWQGSLWRKHLIPHNFVRFTHRSRRCSPGMGLA
jgi:hypothetical protein